MKTNEQFNPRDIYHESYWITSPYSWQVIKNPKCALSYNDYLRIYALKESEENKIE